MCVSVCVCVCVGMYVFVSVCLSVYVCVWVHVHAYVHTCTSARLNQVVLLSCDVSSYLQTPHCAHMRTGYKYGNVTMVDTLLKDCLVDPFHDCHMGNTGMIMLLAE